MNRVKSRSPRKVGGVSFAFVARGFPSTIKRKARAFVCRGYRYRIIVDGRHRVLYVGPKRQRLKARAKKMKLKKKRKVKK